ncbi:hypothetical protein NCS57_00019300 [Fusarium keratoplasticum]|uniref:Uncharacterized protein n=1 Tax=Fusarium keratoplasticum TaxID=1328300 RepID=A0ACC0RBC2_9HYPO|nr:hypothetical protein NCS57_00019300 [Fusarium keratoplasticum]KAI8683548.1 hypothetical protein NCS57_00019300 [Fusarium keratoplasticum]
MDDLSHLDSSFPDKPSRPVQHGALALLPVELLIQIFNHLLDAGDSGRALALSSCSIRLAVIQDFYRHNGKAIFLLGLQTADVAMLQRCERFGVASTRYVWEVPICPLQRTNLEDTPYPGSIWREGRKGAIYHRPVDRLLESAFAGDHIEQKHYNALKWLVERRHDASSSNERLPGKHMVRSLPSQLQKVRDRKSMVCLSRMLQLLSTWGFPTPCTKFALDRLPGIGSEIPSYLIISGDYHGKLTDRDEVRGNLVSVSMRSHCPSSVLRVVLQDYKSRGVQLKNEYAKPPVGMQVEYDDERDWDDTCWWHTCRMDDLLGILHGDRFGLWGWEEAYPGEVTDIFTEKLELLVDYEALTKEEKGMLVTVQEAMEDIDNMQKESSLTGLALQKAAWEKLWTAVGPYARKARVMSENRVVGRLRKERLHKFAFYRSERLINPWASWHAQAELQKRLQAWGPMSVSDFEQALRKDRDWQHMWKVFWWALDVNKPGERCDPWSQVGIDEWLSTLKRKCPLKLPRDGPSMGFVGWIRFFNYYDRLGRYIL